MLSIGRTLRVSVSEGSFWNLLAGDPHKCQARTHPFPGFQGCLLWSWQENLQSLNFSDVLGPKPQWEEHMYQHARGIKSQQSTFVWTGRLSGLTGCARHPSSPVFQEGATWQTYQVARGYIYPGSPHGQGYRGRLEHLSRQWRNC